MELIPDLPVVRIDNSAHTTSNRRSQRLIVARTERHIVVRGAVWQGSGPSDTWVTVPDPVDYFGRASRRRWPRRGSR